MIIAELQQNSLLREDMTDDNLADFLSSTYNKDKNNVTFQRLNKLMFVEIPLVLCGGDNGLTQLSDNSATWENYAQHYTYGLEALVILMFETQLRYLTGEVSNDPQDLETVSHSDTSMLSDGVQKKKGGQPKNKQGFCPKKHTACKTNVRNRRIETTEWFGWYGVAVQSIADHNQSELDRMRRNGGEGENSPENSAGNGVTLNTQDANIDGVSPPEREYMEIELRMYNELQAKNVNKRAKISEDDGDVSSSEDVEDSTNNTDESGEQITNTVDHLLVTERAEV
jgi:hypothetical protein